MIHLIFVQNRIGGIGENFEELMLLFCSLWICSGRIGN